MQVQDLLDTHLLTLTLGNGSETALHAAFRIGSNSKTDLLLEFEANSESTWIGDSHEEIRHKYSFLSKLRARNVYNFKVRSYAALIYDLLQ